MHKINSYIQEELHDITILLIGAGGNGSFMLNNLARLNYALQMLGKKGIHVTLCDFDEVSETNVGRQLFAPSDLGKNKAEVLINRINRAFGTVWLAEKHGFTDESEIKQNITITAVDNVLTRRRVQESFLVNSTKNCSDYEQPLYWLDLGNSKDYGQAILTDGHKMKSLFDYYPDLEDEVDDGPSCSMAEALAKQELFINSTLCQLAGKLLTDLFLKDTLDYHGFYLNLNPMSVKQIPI